MPSKQPSGAGAMELLTFDTQFAERLWGGTHLERYGKRLPQGKTIGESWEISDVEGKPSPLSGAAAAGRTLRDLLRQREGAAWLLGGVKTFEHPQGGPQFPLLVKLLDAQQDLSIQVHPTDADLAAAGAPSAGKTEAWVILEAVPGARVAFDLAPGLELEAFFDRVERLGGARLPPAEEESLFQWVPVQRGDVIFVPAGTIHAVGKGIVLLEVQQTSDVTYRIYDWGRLEKNGKPRDLHLGESRRVSRPSKVPCPFARIFPPEPNSQPGFREILGPGVCDKFTLELAQLGPGSPSSSELRGSPRGSSCHILTAFSGSAVLETCGGARAVLAPGQLVLIPAATAEYVLRAAESAQILRYVPLG